jgi:site-specific recombinase XerD
LARGNPRSDDQELIPLSPTEAYERFIQYRKDRVDGNTVANDKTRLRFFQEWCEQEEIENLNNLTGRDLSNFVAWRRQQVKAITLQKQLGTIREALRFWADIEAVPQGLDERIHAPELPDGAKSKDVYLDQKRAERLIEHLDRHEYASQRHVQLLLFWRTAMRRAALRSIDVDDLRPDDFAIVLEHRPDAGTRLKNHEDGDRWVQLRPDVYQVVEDYVHEVRPDRTDDFGREPLFTTRYGRPSGDTIYKRNHRVTQPCELGFGCPHDRNPDECEARDATGQPYKCPSSRGPHSVRRGSITAHLNESVKPDVVSERCDVSLEVLYEHYDVRTDREKMEVRQDHLDGNWT